MVIFSKIRVGGFRVYVIAFTWNSSKTHCRQNDDMILHVDFSDGSQWNSTNEIVDISIIRSKDRCAFRCGRIINVTAWNIHGRDGAANRSSRAFGPISPLRIHLCVRIRLCYVAPCSGNKPYAFFIHFCMP